MAEAEEDVLAHTAFPEAHWNKIYSNNLIERLNREIKRRTNCVGIFPNDAAIIRSIRSILISLGRTLAGFEALFQPRVHDFQAT